MNKITKVVITAAGTGTRLLPLTKETPKEMLPIYVKSRITAKPVLKPILHLIFDSVYDSGIRDFCFVVGRGKRSIEDHFLVSKIEKKELAKVPEMKVFFSKLNKINATYVQQPSPKGFGDAVLRSKSFVGNDNFLLHAGDDAILSRKNNHLQRLEKTFFKHKADITLLVTRTKDPSSSMFTTPASSSIIAGIGKAEHRRGRPDGGGAFQLVTKRHDLAHRAFGGPTAFCSCFSTDVGRAGRLRDHRQT